MLATVASGTVVGVTGVPVTVEVHVATGLPGFSIVGLPDASCREARDRVRAALLCSGFTWPNRRITVNLAPSGVRKSGAGLDLAIALGVALASEQLVDVPTDRVAFIGELGLDGALRPVRGALPAVGALDVDAVVVPARNVTEARIGTTADVRAASHLTQVIEGLRGDSAWPQCAEESGDTSPDEGPDLSEVRGQPFARMALEVAAAGGHHLLLVGPPGAGKTMLAERLPGLLPPLDPRLAYEVACVRSVLGEPLPGPAMMTRPPFRAPHHTASMVSMVGGGSAALRPGELTRAHGGVLFLDELGEFPASVLDAMRQPLEDRVVRVSRAHASATFPADFLLIAATNPCPCGFAPALRCRCGPAEIARYRRRLSGPLLDRFDLRLAVSAPDHEDLLAAGQAETSDHVAERVAAARQRARTRGVSGNAALSGAGLARWMRLDDAARRLLTDAVAAGRLSGRGVRRVSTVALTLDDLSGGDGNIGAARVSLAMALRAELDHQPSLVAQ